MCIGTFCTIKKKMKTMTHDREGLWTTLRLYGVGGRLIIKGSAN